MQQNIQTYVQMGVQGTTDMPGWKLININEHENNHTSYR